MLQIKELTKKYGKFTAVDNLNLEVSKGEIFGFVGPNGAGKTTTMKIICGLLRADSGEVILDGIDARKNMKALKSKIGYMPDFFGVYDDLKVHEYLDFYASIYKVAPEARKSMISDLLQLVDLEHKRNFYVDSLSRGMKQRLCLARCLVHNPKLLVLDEPASGMDPRARVEMKDILRTLKDMDKTIIISSHILSELAELCTSIGIVDNGKVVISGSVDDIMKQIYSKRLIKIKVKNKVEEALMILKEFPNLEKVTNEDHTIQVAFEGNDDDMSMILGALIKKDIPVFSFAQLDGSLEDVFMKVTKGDIG